MVDSFRTAKGKREDCLDLIGRKVIEHQDETGVSPTIFHDLHDLYEGKIKGRIVLVPSHT